MHDNRQQFDPPELYESPRTLLSLFYTDFVSIKVCKDAIKQRSSTFNAIWAFKKKILSMVMFEHPVAKRCFFYCIGVYTYIQNLQKVDLFTV